MWYSKARWSKLYIAPTWKEVKRKQAFVILGNKNHKIIEIHRNGISPREITAQVRGREILFSRKLTWLYQLYKGEWKYEIQNLYTIEEYGQTTEVYG